MKKTARIAFVLSILLAVAMVVPLPAYGRIGETPEQCKQRYGEPVRGGRDVIRILEDAFEGRADDPQVMSLTFKKGEFDICITFFNGKAAKIDYHKNGAFGQGEMGTLLDLNSGRRQQWDVAYSGTTDLNAHEKKKWFEKQNKIPASQGILRTSFFMDSPRDQSKVLISLTADYLDCESDSTLTITTGEFLAYIEAREKASRNKNLDGF